MRINQVRLAVCFALFAFITPAHSQPKQVNIGILVDEFNVDVRPILSGLKDEIVSVVGNDAQINFPENALLINGYDQDLASRHYQDLLDQNIDIILAFGPINSLVVSEQVEHKKPTILFGAINQDLLDLDQSKTVSGIDNLTYLIASQSYKQDLESFADLFDYQNIGVVVGHLGLLEGRIEAVLDEIVAGIGAQYRLISYTGVDDFASQLGAVDAIYLAEGFSITSGDISQIAELLNSRRIPSFTSTGKRDVELGLMATNRADENYDQLFRRIALDVEAAVNGKNLADQPIYIEYSDTLTVNYNTAERVGAQLRYSQISTTDLVGSIDKFYTDQSYTLEQVALRALAQNLSLQSARKDLQLAEINVSSARTSYLPNLTLSADGTYVDPDLAELSAGQSPERSSTGSLILSQVIYSNEASTNIGIQKSLESRQREDFNADQLDLILNATTASIDLLSLGKNIEIEQQNLDSTRRNLKVAQSKFDAGQASKADIFRFQSEVANNMQGLIGAITAYGQGVHALNTYLNNPIDTHVGIVNVSIESDQFDGLGYAELAKMLDDPSQRRVVEDFLVVEAMQKSPELKSIGFNLDAVEADQSQYGWRRFLPEISAQAQYNQNISESGVGTPAAGQSLEDDYYVGLTLSVPLFNQNTEHVSKYRAETERQQLLIGRAEIAQSLELRVRDAVLDVSAQTANISLSEVAEEAARQSLDLTEASYANGAVTIADLIDAQNNYFQAQSASFTAKYDFIKSAINLERQIGYFYFLRQSSTENAAFIQRLTEFQNNPQTQR